MKPLCGQPWRAGGPRDAPPLGVLMATLLVRAPQCTCTPQCMTLCEELWVDLPACSRRAARVLGHGAGSRRPRTMWGSHARGLHRRETPGPFNVRNCKAQEPGKCKQLGGFEFDTLYGIGVHVPTTL